MFVISQEAIVQWSKYKVEHYLRRAYEAIELGALVVGISYVAAASDALAPMSAASASDQELLEYVVRIESAQRYCVSKVLNLSSPTAPRRLYLLASMRRS